MRNRHGASKKILGFYFNRWKIDKVKIPERIKIGGHLYDIKYPYYFRERDDIFGRTVVKALAQGLLQVLKDNFEELKVKEG